LHRLVILGDLDGASQRVAALAEALMRPGRSPLEARNRFRDLVVLMSRAFAARASVAEASLAWSDQWSGRVHDAPTALDASLRLKASWDVAVQELVDRPSSTVTRAQEFIRAHATERVSVSTVAAAVGFHPDYLSHRFRQELGVTVGAYLSACRLARAKELLTTSRAPIASVASSAGFADPRYFSRFFRRETGMSPREYRRVLGGRQPAQNAASDS
jgi:AraC-like DNA-binding protein